MKTISKGKRIKEERDSLGRTPKDFKNIGRGTTVIDRHGEPWYVSDKGSVGELNRKYPEYEIFEKSYYNAVFVVDPICDYNHEDKGKHIFVYGDYDDVYNTVLAYYDDVPTRSWGVYMRESKSKRMKESYATTSLKPSVFIKRHSHYFKNPYTADDFYHLLIEYCKKTNRNYSIDSDQPLPLPILDSILDELRERYVDAGVDILKNDKHVLLGEAVNKYEVYWNENWACRMRGTDSDRPNQTSTFKDAQELLDFLDDEGVIYLEDDEYWADIYEANTLSDDVIDDLIERCNDMDISGGDAIIFSIKTPSGMVYETDWDPEEFELDDDADYADYYDDDDEDYNPPEFDVENFEYYTDEEDTGISVFLWKDSFDQMKRCIEKNGAQNTIRALIKNIIAEDPSCEGNLGGLYIDTIYSDAITYEVTATDDDGEVICRFCTDAAIH